MRRQFAFYAAAMCAALLTTVSASQGPNVDIATRARGADRVVVGTIVSVQASFEKSLFGDFGECHRLTI